MAGTLGVDDPEAGYIEVPLCRECTNAYFDYQEEQIEGEYDE